MFSISSSAAARFLIRLVRTCCCYFGLCADTMEPGNPAEQTRLQELGVPGCVFITALFCSQTQDWYRSAHLSLWGKQTTSGKKIQQGGDDTWNYFTPEISQGRRRIYREEGSLCALLRGFTDTESKRVQGWKTQTWRESSEKTFKLQWDWKPEKKCSYTSNSMWRLLSAGNIHRHLLSSWNHRLMSFSETSYQGFDEQRVLFCFYKPHFNLFRLKSQ